MEADVPWFFGVRAKIQTDEVGGRIEFLLRLASYDPESD